MSFLISLSDLGKVFYFNFLHFATPLLPPPKLLFLAVTTLFFFFFFFFFFALSIFDAQRLREPQRHRRGHLPPLVVGQS